MAKKLYKIKGQIYKKSNDESTKILFYKKQLYAAEFRDFPRHVVDFNWAEKYLYGRVDRYNTPIVLNKRAIGRLKSIGDTDVVALDFVVGAFNDMMTAHARDKMERKIRPGDFIADKIRPTKGYQDPEKLYNEYFQAFTDVMVKRFNNSNTPVLDFRQFIDMLKGLLSTAEGIRRMPFTKTAFIKSRLCPINCSGLVIEVADFDHSDDMRKIETFVESDNWNYYVNACNQYGFMIDRNAPWRLVADVNSEGMAIAMDTHGAGAMEWKDMIQTYHKYPFTGDLRRFPDKLLRLYNAVRRRMYIIPTYCHETGRTIPKHVASKEYTVFSLKELFGKQYFWKLYFDLRVMEEESTLSDADKQRLIESAIGYEKAYGIQTAVISFEKKLNQTFDYNGSMSYYHKREQMREEAVQESESGSTQTAAAAQSGPAVNYGGGGY